MNALKQVLLSRLQSGAPRSNFSGRGRRTSSRFNGYETSLVTPPVNSLAVIEQGERSPFNSAQPLHRQSVKLSIYNPSANAADIVITAGDHTSSYTGQVMTQGTATYTNDEGASAAGVVVGCDFGTGGVGSVANFQSMVKRKGIIVLGTRFRYKISDSQLVNKIHFRQYDEFGNHGFDSIDPEVDFSNRQYQANLIDIDLMYVLNRDTTMKLRVNALETVSLTLYVSEIQNLDNILLNRARSIGSNIIL